MTASGGEYYTLRGKIHVTIEQFQGTHSQPFYRQFEQNFFSFDHMQPPHNVKVSVCDSVAHWAASCVIDPLHHFQMSMPVSRLWIWVANLVVCTTPWSDSRSRDLNPKILAAPCQNLIVPV